MSIIEGSVSTRSQIAEIVARVLAGEQLSEPAAVALLQCPEAELPCLLNGASVLRDRGKGHDVTYSRKVFLPVTNLCRDRCSYCTFRKDPGEPGAWTMSLAEIAQWSRRGGELGCKEALMCLGDKPELAFPSYRQLLASFGVASTIEYVAAACRVALEQGLLPHTNAGIMSGEEMQQLRPLNASMGLMLESISPRLRQRGGVHQWAPDKDPVVRMRMLEQAGELQIPFTTGILLGIGENLVERAQSLIALRAVHERHGHIQEVIIQNFRAKPDIAMVDAPEPQAGEMARVIATARLVFGPTMNLQAPPNLSPHEIELFLQAGINDWGGISPLSKDYVNPEAPWPHLVELADRCARAGFHLKQRLAIYPEFINERWVDPAMMPAIARLTAQLSVEV